MKKKIQHCIFNIILIPFLTMNIAACGSIEGEVADTVVAEDTRDAGTVSLNYYTWSDEAVYISDAVTAVNALHNNIKVTLHTLPNNNYNTAISTLLSHQDGTVDICATKGMADLISMYQDGLILNITDKVKESLRSGDMDPACYGTLFNDLIYEGEYIGLPTRTTCWALYYNKDLFEQAGITMPESLTWAEYENLAEQLTGKDAFGRKIYGSIFIEWIPNLIALQQGSYLTDDDLSMARESLRILQSFYQDGAHVSYNELLEHDTSTYVYELFENGRTAMAIQGEWMVNILKDDRTDVNWAVAPLPVPDGVNADTTTGQYQLASITSSSKHPEEAWEFLSFLTGGAGASVLAQNAIIPAYNNDDIAQEYGRAAGAEGTDYFFRAQKYPEQIPIAGYRETIDSFSTNAKLYFSGQYSLDQAMEMFNEEREGIFCDMDGDS